MDAPLSTASIPQVAATVQAQQVTADGATNRDIALHYRAAYGWCALPGHRVAARRGGVYCTCTGWRTCSKPGKHPIGLWGWEALPSCPTHEELRERWGNRRHDSIAILTGSRSGVVVADIDPRHGGNLDTLLDAGWPLETCIAQSGGGGLHVYARMPHGVDRVASLSAYLPGIELKADSTLVIAPPSGHVSGREYAWALGHEPDVVPPAELPRGVWDAIFHRPEARRTVRLRRPAPEDNSDMTPAHLARLAAKAPYYVDKAIARARTDKDGGRNHTGRWLAQQLHSLRLPFDTALMYMNQYGKVVEHDQ
jgi:Bifunctional DNA primase/polymerase, N-terminal